MTEFSNSLRLGVEQVTARLDPAKLPFQTTDEIHALDAVFGQERATRAIEFALGMTQPGYNLYASGPDGIGKSSIIEGFLRRRAAQLPTPRDWVYVHNFNDPDHPIGISLPAGSGRQFAEQVRRAVESAGEELRTIFESDSYARQHQELAASIEQERATILESLQSEAIQLGFMIQMTPQGISSAPLIDGKTLTTEEFQSLPDSTRVQFQTRGVDLEKRVQDTMFEMRAIERSARERFEQLDSEVAAFAIGYLFEPLIEAHGGDDELAEFLNAARADLEHERDKFRSDVQQQPLLSGIHAPTVSTALTRRYEVNAAICHEPTDGAPVVFEQHPTYNNLLGRIEYQGQFGSGATDHTFIKPGSLAMANGGFIVLRLRDLLTNAPALDGLKRALSTAQISIENLGEAYGPTTTSGLRPEPIPLDVKVVIIGDPGLYSMLYRLDPEFRELFRVKADFETDFNRNDENTIGLAAYIRSQCDRGGMRCLEAGAVARLVEHSSRMVDDQNRLSANLSTLLDLVRQSDYWAGLDGAEAVTAKHVDRALNEAVYRSALVRDRIQEMIQEGTVRVETDDAVVGQINALSVYDLGDISFGRPSRVTCVVSPGRGQIIMVERESDMAGRIHNKGFLILRGFLTGRFGQHVASTLHASITFEQLYGDIDGDSASSTELYVLLSALANVPVRQGIAVTGSIDQHGRIQPIGGATNKIEGFHAVCKQRGLDGTHGVMIPRTNVSSVVLRPEVAQDIADGLFHIWAVDTIEEGIEVLTGIPAGERDHHGIYPEGTVFRKVRDRLTEFAAELRAGPDGAVPAPEPRLYTPQVPTPMPPGIPPQPPPDPPVIV
jgi:predicted ATP-dependent protease